MGHFPTYFCYFSDHLFICTPRVKERPRNCDMSGLAYVFVVFWITFLSSVSLSSLLSLLKQFQKGIMSGLCWFLLPAVVILYSFFAITNGKINVQETVLFLILNIPWMLVWIFYYYRFTTVVKWQFFTSIVGYRIPADRIFWIWSRKKPI